MFSHKVVNRSFLVLCLVFAVIFAAMIYVVRERTAQIINQLSVDRIMAAKQGFDNYLDDLSNQAMTRGAILAHQNRLIDAIKEYEESGFELDGENTDFPQYDTIVDILDEFLYGFDFISVTERDGTALARVDNGERDYPLPLNGYTLMSNPDVRDMFETGEPVASLTFMLDNTSLVATTLYPIYDYDGKTLLGNVTCLCDLTNPKYINAYKDQSGSEVAIFLGQEQFISTFSYSDDAETRITLIPGVQVIEAIFENKEDYYISVTPIGGTSYGTIFSPLTYRGEIIGMLFTGIDVHEAMTISNDMDTLIQLIAALAVLITLIIILVIQRYNRMIKKQMALQALMTRISQSFLSDDDLDTLINNAFRDIGTQMRVSQIVLFRLKSGADMTYTCTNKWADPALRASTKIGDEIVVPGELLGAYLRLRGSDKFYMSSDEKAVAEALSPYRVLFKHFISTCVYLNDEIYAVVDFSVDKKRGKWSRDDLNAATFVSNILTAAFHRKQIEEQLVTAKETAERSNRYKSTFLANVSHEIRTPMNAILGITEIYLQDREARANIEEGLSMIYDSGNLLLGIINDILDLSKIEAGKMEIVPSKYDIPSLINDTVQICRLRYGSKPIEFVLDIDKNTPLNLMGDELRIRQVLNNILSNAFKYTDTGEIKLSVSADVAMAADGGKPGGMGDSNVVLIIRVSDTGQGMSDEQINRLFDEFTRFNMEVNRTTVGTGLGMSITKQLLRLMNGTIDVESKPKKGSTFTVRLPQKRIDTAICGSEMSEKLNSFRFPSMSLRKKTQVVCEYMPYGSVLVVDDVDSNLFVSKGMLIPYGLKVETAGSGFETIEYVASGKTYDIIFMDHMMPKMDGIETVKNLRAMGYTGYIIALTANALVGQAEIFMENGFDGYIPKPIDTRELNTVLIEFIRNKKPQSVINAAREEAREAELLRSLEAGSETAEEMTEKEKAMREKAEREKAELIESFLSDAGRIVNILEKECNSLKTDGSIDIDSFRISAHGIKNALRLVGERECSDAAYGLEKAAIDKDYELIKSTAPEFIDALKAVIKKLGK